MVEGFECSTSWSWVGNFRPIALIGLFGKASALVQSGVRLDFREWNFGLRCAVKFALRSVCGRSSRARATPDRGSCDADSGFE
jgi:hypothetical protein